MPAVFGALTVDRGDVDFARDFADVRALPEQRVDLLDFGALRLASCERPGEAPRVATCPRTGTTLILKGVVHLGPASAAAALDDPTGCDGDWRARCLLRRVLSEGRE